MFFINPAILVIIQNLPDNKIVFFEDLRSKSQRPGQPALLGECAKPEQTFEYDV